MSTLSKTSYYGAFKPTSIAGCALWLDGADQSSTGMTLSGTNVTSWNDKSGNGRNLTASGSYPTITSNGLLFNGATPNVLSNATAFAAFNGINSFVVFNSTVASTRQRVFVYVYTGQNIGLATDTTYNSVYSSTIAGDGPVTYSANTTYIYGVNTYASSPFITHSENGTETQYPSTYSTNTSTQTQLLVGGQSTVYFTGTIKEVILYDAFLTTAQRQQVEGYLAWKWGIQTSLPFFTGSLLSSPTVISGCQLWLDGADSSSSSMTLSGSNVTTWIDKSGTGNNMTVTGTGYPFLSTTSSGLQCIGFNGSNNFYKASTVMSGSNNTYFFVATATTNTTGGLMYWGDNGRVLGDWFYYNNPVGYFSFSSNQFFTPSNALVAITENVGVLCTGYINGTSNGSQSSVSMGSNQSLMIGSQSANYWKGTIQEVIIYNSAFTTTQRQQVEGYLAWKWGIQSKLPTNHPYYSAAPNHPYYTAAPIGASIRPAISLALAPTGVGAMSKSSYYASFTPTSIAGCSLWLDGADSSSFTFSSGTTISQWNDKSGSANNFTVTTGTTTRITDGSFNVVNFPSSGSTMTSSSSITLTTNHSVFIVTKLISNPFGFGYLLSCPSLKPSDNAQGVSGDYSIRYNPSLITPSTGNGGDIFYNNTGGYYTNGTLSGVPTSTSYHMLDGRFSQGGSTQIALSFGGVYGRYFVGTVAEVIIFSQVLTTTQRQTIEGYLAWKWGLQAQLPVYTPKSITGCSLWYDAADTTTLALSGGNATSWTDKASGIVLTSGTPAYTTSNSYPLVRFNGSVTYTSSTNLPFSGVCTSNANFTSFIVAATSSSTGVNGLPFDVYLSGNASRFAPFVNSDGSIFFDGATQGSPRLGGITQSLNTPQILTFSRTGITTMYANVNGTQKSTYNFTSPANFSSGSYIIYMSQGGAAWKGDMYEVLYYNVDLTAAQVQQVEGYLAWKWGLQASLPVAHTYYSAAPTGHPYIATAPLGASIRPAISQALAPTGVKSMGKSTYYATFTPTQIAGCQLWLDGADASTVTGTTTVTAWADKSSKAYSLVPGTGTTSYANNAITINSSYLYATGAVDLTTFTFFIVAKNIGTSYNQPFFGALPNTSASTFDSTDGFGWYMDNGNSTRFFGRYINNTGQWITTSINTLSPGLYTVTGTSAGVYTQWNNGTLGNNVTSSSRTSTARGFTVGGEWYGPGSTYYTYTNSGSIYEVIVYNTVLSAAQRQQVEGYLAWKWGIQASLPTTHYYASSAPIGVSLRPAISAALAPLPVSITVPPYDWVDSTSWTSLWQPYLKALAASNSSATAVFSSNAVSGSEPNTNGSWSMNLAPNGLIYTFPTNNNSYVGIINPTTSVYTYNAISSGLGSDGYKYIGGGALSPNGKIYVPPSGNPANSVNVGVFTPSGSSGTFTTIASTTNSANDAFAGGAVLAPNGMIYFIPRGSAYIGRIDTTGTFSSNAVSGTVPTGEKYQGGVLGPNGLIYCIPCGVVPNVGVIDPAANTYSSNYVTMVNTVVNYAFLGGVLAPNGKIYCIPHNQTTVGIIDTVANTFTNGAALSSATNAAGPGYGNGAYYGGCLGPDGSIYCAPLVANNVLVINPTTNTVSYISTGFTTPLYHGILMAPNGKLYMKATADAPVGARSVATISFTGLNQLPSSNWCLSPYANRSP